MVPQHGENCSVNPKLMMMMMAMSYFSCRQLRMAALNRPSSGNMDGINSINYACYREVRIMEINLLSYTIQSILLLCDRNSLDMLCVYVSLYKRKDLIYRLMRILFCVHCDGAKYLWTFQLVCPV